MKKIILIAIALAATLSSCNLVEDMFDWSNDKEDTEDERIYTPDELGMIIEWTKGGWCEVYNNLDSNITLVTTYPSYFPSPQSITSVIEVGRFAKLDAGSYVPGTSIDECETASIKLDDETEILCTRGDDNPWTNYFFQNIERREVYEIVEIDGKKVRHDMIVSTYHIDNTLVNLWNTAQQGAI